MPDQPSLLDPILWSYIGFASISLVLVGSGAAKVLDPSALVAFLSGGRRRTVPETVSPDTVTPAAGRDIGMAIGRAIGWLEILIGLGALSIGGRPMALLVAIVHAFFSVVVFVAIRRGSPSCGCFGAASSRPRPAHLVMNLVSVVLAGIATVRGVPAVADLLRGFGPVRSAIVVAVMLAAAAGVVFVDTR